MKAAIPREILFYFARNRSDISLRQAFDSGSTFESWLQKSAILIIYLLSVLDVSVSKLTQAPTSWSVIPVRARFCVSVIFSSPLLPGEFWHIGRTVAANSQWVDTCCNLPQSLLTQFVRQSKLGKYINVTGVHKSRHQVARAINVVQLFLIIVDHQHGICFMSRFWHLEFGSRFCVFVKIFYPSTRQVGRQWDILK
jgi:hypothetical protein